MCWNVKYVILLLLSTIITYLSGLVLGFVKRKKYEESKRNKYQICCVAICFILNLSILFFFKYSAFALKNISYLLNLVHVELNIPEFDIMLPVGISFYTFQALSYTMDVYRDEIYLEKNFFKYALFVSFFPQLVAGPIERSKNLLKQLSLPQRFDFGRARSGFLLMLWGFFLKLVIADRIAIFVDMVYMHYDIYRGYYIIVATMLFAIQIYCDFYGYSSIAMGAAEILGIRLMENFNSPYLSQSMSEFWRRWHVSLNSWFRDYLYIPIGGSKKGKIRKYINTMIVFAASGLWHGAEWTFVIWGGINGICQVAGEILKPVRDRLVKILRLNRNSWGHKAVCIVSTFIIIDITWFFFRVENISGAKEMIKALLAENNMWIFFDGSLYECGLDSKNFWLMIYSCIVVLFADIQKYKGICVREFIIRQDYWLRWVIIAFGVWFVVVFGVWGSGYDASKFIYFQF
ncbi:MBOAT family O-acyltransferase [Lachnospiraceae bacterium 54-11]